ncbi:MAG TPA: 5-guanidino-2-oxopentanoate decarboxylase [Thermohalobaculum sp.]|nr:5-guanidino-2-oxopentanoate decarboxylase [Thermohalobaculum sp.]
MPTLGERLVEWLEAYGVDTVFGIPGVHTVEMYRGLAASDIHHVTPRHEQGAGFMADGYARVSGRPGVAFVITGPGLTNIATAMAQAYGDSVPMLVVSAVNARGALGMEAGDLHEVRRQSLIAGQCAAFSHTIMTPGELPAVLARAWAVFEGARPRPVHIEIPRDLFSIEAGQVPFNRPQRLTPPAPGAAGLAEAARWLGSARKPLILTGGGARWAADGITVLAERLGAPVVMTTNARGILSGDHPLAVPASPSLEAIRDLIGTSDVVLALGTEIGRTDYDMYDRSEMIVQGRLIRVDIDPEQIGRGAVPDLALVADVGEAVPALRLALGDAVPARDGATRARVAREVAFEELGAAYRASVGFLDMIRDTLPNAPIVGDSTQAVYAGNLYYAAPAPSRWFNAATGYGALGYGLPAAIGAARAIGGPVVCIAGDGGLQFTLTEIGAAIEEGLRVILLVWNNQGYGEIKSYMVARQITPVGVDLHTPDFVAIAKAYCMAGVRMDTLEVLPTLLREAAARPGPTLIEFDESVVQGR